MKSMAKPHCIDVAIREAQVQILSLIHPQGIPAMNIYKSTRLAVAMVATMLIAFPASSQTFQFQVPIAGLNVETDLMFTKVAVGSTHACGLTPANGVMCWGSGGSGKLGTGNSASSALPVQVVGMESGVLDIQSGQSHTCALTSGGIMKCWGANGGGQLGNGIAPSLTSYSTPNNVIGLPSAVASIAVGYNHTCATTINGAAYCWGNNLYGQLGNGATSSTGQSTPTLVQGLSSGVSSIAAGGEHTCAKMISGSLRCWGNNTTGAVGDGTFTRRTSPVTINGLSSAVASVTAARYHTCATDVVGAAYCWGNGGQGSLGNGSTQNRSTPTLVSGINTGATLIDGGINHTCAIVNATAKCWGFNNKGQLGDGSTVNTLIPISVQGISKPLTSLSTGDYLTCAVEQGGKTYCWGQNSSGQLGNGTVSDSAVPTQVVKE